jgi:hypothetical protein
MKSNIFYTIIFSLLISITFSQELALNNSAVAKRMSIETAPKAKNEYHSLWGTSAARTVKQGRVESGLFGPLRIGLKNNMELQVHPLLFFVIPNARLKKNWTLNQSNKLQVASEHGFTFPTILLNLLAKSGTGGILPPTKSVPAILTLKNKIIVSYYYHKDHSVSLKGALEMNLLQSMNSGMEEIHLSFVYPRTAVYNNFYTGEVALNFAGVFAKKIGYDADIRIFLIPDTDLTWVFEWNPKLYYNFSNKFRIMAGAVLTTGNIPHEKAKFRALPVLDLQWTFSKKKKK